MQQEVEKLKKEIELLKNQLRSLKDNLRTEIIAQQTNTRDPFRSDKGELVLKKNSNIKSRKSLSPLVDNVLSYYFNTSLQGKTNTMYFGFDGGNGMANVNQIITSVIHDTTKPIDANGLYGIRIDDDTSIGELRNPLDNRNDAYTFVTGKNKLLGGTDDLSNFSVITGNGDNGYSALGYWLSTSPNELFITPVKVQRRDILLDISNGGTLKINGTNGLTGTFTNPTSITVVGGIVTNITT